MNGTACVLFNPITERVGMPIVYLSMASVECLKECLFSPRAGTDWRCIYKLR